MKSLFEPIEIGKLNLRNRVIRSATMESAGDENGRIKKELAGLYTELARGGVGAIITGMMAIDENASALQTMIKTYSSAFVEDYRTVAAAVHEYDCKLIVQLAHCGVKATQPFGPSPFPEKKAQGMTMEQIRQIPASFAEAARRCKEAGADGVELHGAHGYLLSQFLSPVFNQRTDKYGGSLENRARILFEVYAAVRRSVGTDYAVWIKINGDDRMQGGMSLEESKWVCSELSKMGIDAIEVSGGVSLGKESASTPMNAPDLEGIFAVQALEIAGDVKTPVISVGGYRTPEKMTQIINQGVDAISICRPFICEPDLLKRWESDAALKPRCISCNKCFGPGFVSCKAFSSGS